jgi:hypothetical protein
MITNRLDFLPAENKPDDQVDLETQSASLRRFRDELVAWLCERQARGEIADFLVDFTSDETFIRLHYPVEPWRSVDDQAPEVCVTVGTECDGAL